MSTNSDNTPKGSVIDEDSGFMVPKDLNKSIFDSSSHKHEMNLSNLDSNYVLSQINFSNSKKHMNKIVNLESEKKKDEENLEIEKKFNKNEEDVEMYKQELFKKIMETNKKASKEKLEIFKNSNFYFTKLCKDNEKRFNMKMQINKEINMKKQLLKNPSIQYSLEPKEELYSHCIDRIFFHFPSKVFNNEKNYTENFISDFKNKFITKIITKKNFIQNKIVCNSMKLISNNDYLDFGKCKKINFKTNDVGFIVNKAVQIEYESKRFIICNKIFTNEMKLFAFNEHDGNLKETISFVIPLPLKTTIELGLLGNQIDNYIIDFKVCIFKRKLFIVVNSKILGSNYYSLYHFDLKKYTLSEEINRIKCYTFGDREMNTHNYNILLNNICLYQLTHFKGNLFLLYSNTNDTRFYKVNYDVKDKEGNLKSNFKEFSKCIQSVDILTLTSSLIFYSITCSFTCNIFCFETNNFNRKFDFSLFLDSQNDKVNNIIFMKGCLILFTNNYKIIKFDWKTTEPIETINTNNCKLFPWSNGSFISLDRYTGNMTCIDLFNETKKNKNILSIQYPQSDVLIFKKPKFVLNQCVYTICCSNGNILTIINITV